MIGLFLLIVACGTKPEVKTFVCDSEECFIEKANNCEDVTLNATEEYGTLAYSSKNCTFTKTLLSTTGEEEIRKLIEGKSLSCTYEQGKFDQRWISSIVFGIEYCDGELKDRIVDLMAFL
jgi:hypothetical protein